MRFLYGQNGLVGFIIDGITYTYRKNLFGDIIGIFSGNTEMATYVYDAWGNCTITKNTNGLGTLNPFRYRGYYWDSNLGLYYLISRYYDPQTGRFINADSLDYLDPQTLGGLNLYAYCGNNPVMGVDPGGHSALLTLIALLLFTPVGGTTLQVAISTISYAGMAFASIFDEDIRNDMKAIGWNPFNTDESAALNFSKVSFYKGVPVFRTAKSRPGSFGAICLTKYSNADDLRHERGHNSQLMMMGIVNYGLMIGLPSWQGWSKRLYHERPWEITADVFGGVTGTPLQADVNRGYWYLGVSLLFGPLGYFFLLGEY